MNFNPSFRYKNRLIELWEKSWVSMAGHQTSAPEIHRKVVRMVTPMSELDAKLMLKQMSERFR